jgi:hypothetical protein
MARWKAVIGSPAILIVLTLPAGSAAREKPAPSAGTLAPAYLAQLLAPVAL